MSALFNYVLFVKLGIAPDVFSYNYYVIFVAAILVAVTYLWVRKTFGSFAVLVSAFSLGLFPIFWAESHNNVKDIPEAVFYSLFLFSFYEAVMTREKKYIWMSAILAGMAFATKFNFLFVIPTIILWLVVTRKRPPLHFSFLLIPFAMVLFWIITFPASWFEPKLLLASFSYYKSIGTSPVGNDWTYPLTYLLFTTPPVILIFSAIAVASAFLKIHKKEKDALLLAVFWFLVPITRVMFPGTAIYGGVRQIMEYIPALAILAGIGASKLIRVPKALILLSFIPLVITLVRLHPNEGVYFNSLIGGLKGAKEKNIKDWGQTLGNPHRQGIIWLNKNAEPNATLSLDFELWANLPHIWVRKDIYYDSRLKSGPLRQGEYVMSVTNTSDFLDWYRFKIMDTFLNPVYQVEVDGVSLLKIWKNDLQHVKDEYKDMKEEKVADVHFLKQDQSITVTLPNVRKLLRIEFANADPTLCEEFNDVVGSFHLYKEKGGKPRALRASSYDFNDRITYTKPSFLFAAEEAKIIVFNVAVDHPCYKTIQAAAVYAIREE